MKRLHVHVAADDRAAPAQFHSTLLGTAPTVVGMLVEGPVVLSMVRIVRRSRGWYERAL